MFPLESYAGLTQKKGSSPRNQSNAEGLRPSFYNILKQCHDNVTKFYGREIIAISNIHGRGFIAMFIHDSFTIY